MNEDKKEAIRAALASGPKTTDELMDAAEISRGNLALFQDIAREEISEGRMHPARPFQALPGFWEAGR